MKKILTIALEVLLCAGLLGCLVSANEEEAEMAEDMEFVEYEAPHLEEGRWEIDED